ncbi:hypothetical protein, partial [Methylobacterium radiotolerans]|uniref:hypothetical protein n=1 Tax=Methylobacterium radiotolerans TaxID=31998 RepID=UPI001AECEF36
PAAGANSEDAGPHAQIPTVAEVVRGAADAPPPAGMPVDPRQRTPLCGRTPRRSLRAGVK